MANCLLTGVNPLLSVNLLTDWQFFFYKMYNCLLPVKIVFHLITALLLIYLLEISTQLCLNEIQNNPNDQI